MATGRLTSVRSPVTGSANTTFLRSIPAETVIRQYSAGYGVDVSGYFTQTPAAELYECRDTGYRFFYPFALAGQGDLYDQFGRFDWYYMPWKWEHEAAMPYLDPSQRILEIGSGGNDFVEKLSKGGFRITGLELNPGSIGKAREKGLPVYPESIEAHSTTHPETYDAVCAFQVLEHISDVAAFLEGSIHVLKKTGKLIISVPNNDTALLSGGERETLNIPPHHMGWWTPDSLRALSQVFPLRVETVLFEPLQDYHLPWYCRVTAERLLGSSGIARRLYYTLRVHRLHEWIAKLFRRSIRGHTVMIIFSKL